MAKTFQVLVSGGGIAGPCFAYWMSKASFPVKITIVERSSVPRNSGQAVDIRDAAVTVLQKMGLEQAIRDKTTTERGTEVVLRDGKSTASFAATGDTSSQGFTSEFEILRGDLASIFHDATKNDKNIEYVFGEYVTAVEPQDDGKVTVQFANRLPSKSYDLVVGADGMHSKIRRLFWGHGPEGDNYVKKLGQYCSFFTIPKIESDTKFSQWYFAPKGRMIVTRPSQYNDTRAYLAVTDSNRSRFDGLFKLNVKQQKEWLAKQMEGAGWQTDRLVKGMLVAEDYYAEEIGQVKMGEEGFVKGSVALCGDAGYCPSPFSGVGTTCAILGAYVLAGEAMKSPEDIPKALLEYQKLVTPYVSEAQTLFPGAPQSATPQSEWGLRLQNTIVSIAASSLVKKAGSLITWLLPRSLSGKQWELPKYSTLK